MPSIVAVVDPVIVGESMVSSTLFSSASEGMPISVDLLLLGIGAVLDRVRLDVGLDVGDLALVGLRDEVVPGLGLRLGAVREDQPLGEERQHHDDDDRERCALEKSAHLGCLPAFCGLHHRSVRQRKPHSKLARTIPRTPWRSLGAGGLAVPLVRPAPTRGSRTVVRLSAARGPSLTPERADRRRVRRRGRAACSRPVRRRRAGCGTAPRSRARSRSRTGWGSRIRRTGTRCRPSAARAW